MATAASSTLFSPCSHSVSRFSSIARSRNAVDDALALRLGDLAEGLALVLLVLRQDRGLQHHVVPPGRADADRRADLELDRLVVELFAHLRVGIGLQLLLGRGQADRVPDRHAAEGLGVAHREIVGDAVRRAHRVGADALGGRRVDLLHLLLPLAGPAHRLAEIVVDDGAAGRLAEAAHQRVLHLGAVAAARLDDAGAELAQHVAEREDLLLVGPDRRDVDALRVEMALVARHRKAERAGLHAVAHEALHLLDFVIGRGALLAVVAHHVIAHRGVADQVADIDAEVVVELVEILRERLPGELEGAQHLHRDRFDIGEEFATAALPCPCAPAPATASNCRR